MHSPPNAARRHFRVEELGGWDALWWPRALKMRIIAIKILRHFGVIPVTQSIWKSFFKKPRPVVDCSFSLGLGGTYVIVNTRGETKRP